MIWAFTVAPIPIVAALRETSILFALLIGMIWLGEKVTPIRGASILLVLCGLAVMRLSLGALVPSPRTHARARHRHSL